MNKLDEFLSASSEPAWVELYAYAKELNRKCGESFCDSISPDDEIAIEIKALVRGSTRLDPEHRLQLLQAMIDCTEYFDKEALQFLLSHAKAMDIFDYEIVTSRLHLIVLEERDREEQRISSITFSQKQIMEVIYSHHYSAPMPSDWCIYHWKKLCKFLNAAFQMDMHSYKSGGRYAIQVYDAAAIMTYGVMQLDSGHRFDGFLKKITDGDYSSVTVTEWNVFWDLEFQIVRKLLHEYIKVDKKEYGTCPRSNLLCVDCPDCFHCSHCSGIGKTIRSTELTVKGLLSIRDEILKTSSAIREKVEKYILFLNNYADHLPPGQRASLVQDRLWSLYLYLHKLIKAILASALRNENYRFLFSDDFEVDAETGKVIVPFYAPEIKLHKLGITVNHHELTASILNLLSEHFDYMIDRCYHCMLIYPQQSPMAVVFPQASMLSQMAKLYKRSLEAAIKTWSQSLKRQA